MADMKLVYFNVRGRAEIIRWICKQADIPLKDERFESEEWAEKKKTISGGKVPVLLVKEYSLPQSLAIARFVAKKGGLVPENDLEAAFVDALADTLYEAMTEFYKTAMSEKSDEDKQKIWKEEWLPKTVVPIMDKLDKRLKDREWYVSDKMTWGDLAMALFFGDVKELQTDAFKNHAAIAAHTAKVRALPKIKSWLQTRPVTKL
ncbi:hypothetical protein Pmani_004334 [Petrolisthes manimaculis]|uniref:glutathione transferase n=1 Tax=Petrolisthes manimaculis TaxID=1843537 RepID=A0AAE1QGP1_9EUCA|nr:hypothetical protein Pmani_004334 [Petrolisthes manimaculis]